MDRNSKRYIFVYKSWRSRRGFKTVMLSCDGITGLKKNKNIAYSFGRKVVDNKYRQEFEEYLKTEKHMALMVLDRVKKYGSRDELHHNNYGAWESISWESFGEQVTAAAKALIHFGIKEKDKTGIFSANRPEWHISDIAVLSIRSICVPVYGTDSAEEARFIINDAELKVIFVGSQEHYDKIYSIRNETPSLQKIIAIHKTIQINKDDNTTIMWEDFLQLGRDSAEENELKKRLSEADYNDDATIIYTSGTTGNPKGVVLTHKNLLHEQWAVINYIVPDVSDRDVSLCFLPLSHIYERSYCYGVFAVGAQIYYCQDPKNILEYLTKARPTFMNSVPRLYEKVYSTIHARLDTVSKVKQALFHWSAGIGKEVSPYRQKNEKIPFLLNVKFKLARVLILNKIRNAFSNNVYAFSAGGAALNSEINEFFYNAAMPLFTGYGLTETSPVVSANTPLKFKFGSVGTPLPLVDVSLDQDTGEILVKGPNVFKEYYNNPEATKNAFTEDGWFKTGDVGRFDEDNFLYITDRIKDLIITSGGKNIAPQKIETMLAEEYLIEYIAIIGDNRKFISALVVPSFEALEEYAQSRGIDFFSRKDLVSRPEIVSLYQDIIDKRTESLGQVEKIKKFTLLPEEFSQETGEITPTLKIRRKVVSEKYKDVIDAMYLS